MDNAMKSYLLACSESSEQRTRWGQYKCTCCVPRREFLCTLFAGSNLIDAIGKQIFRVPRIILSTVERFILKCPYLGGSTIGGFHCISIIHIHFI